MWLTRESSWASRSVNSGLGWDYPKKSLRREPNLHRNYIGGERGERNISLINIVEMAHALKVSPSKLLDVIK